MSNTLYVGYDLGDGETMISILPPGQLKADSARMPTTVQSGEAIVTGYGYNAAQTIILGRDLLAERSSLRNVHLNFKVKPSEGIKVLPVGTQALIRNHCDSGDIRALCALLRAEASMAFAMPRSVRDFTDALFLHPEIQNTLRAYLDKCDEICVFVGHPTKWEKADIEIYRAMLEGTILGRQSVVIAGQPVKLRFGLEPESRAAFLYGRREYMNNHGWEVGKYALVIDVGSSTTDVTAVSGLAVDRAHDDGNPFLGARLIDGAIYGVYRSKLKAINQLEILDALVKDPTAKNIFVLACRVAKEEYFSSARDPRVVAPGITGAASMSDIKITRDEMQSILETRLSSLGDTSWPDAFESFVRKQKLILEKSGKHLDRIILTGGAAKMHFVREICSRVFVEGTILYDHKPAQAVSHGLALVGQANDKSAEFQQESGRFLTIELKKIVKARVPLLADRLASIVVDFVLTDIALKELLRWRSGTHTTLNAAIDAIKERCESKTLERSLTGKQAYGDIMKAWVRDDMLGAVHERLLTLCHSYGLVGMQRKDVDISSVPLGMENVGASAIDGAKIGRDILKPADTLAGIVAAITGIVALVVIPTIITMVLGIVVTLAGAISTALAGAIVAILGMVPGPGWAILCVVAAVGVIKLMMDGWESVKETAMRNVMSYDLPSWVRNRVSIEQLESAMNSSKSELHRKIVEGITSDSSAERIATAVAASLSPQIEVKLKEIRYTIESQ